MGCRYFAPEIRSNKNKFKMKKTLFTMIVMMAMSANAAFAQLSPVFTKRLQTVFDSVCTKYHIKGASAAVLVPGLGTWKSTSGISYTGRPMTTDMLLGIGSNTKTYTATLMLLLQEKGIISLEDTIGKWIKNQPNISGKITIRQLLGHTSGIFNYTENAHFDDSLFADLQRIWKPQEVLAFVDKPYFAPGKSWYYSNTNYLLAGMIIEKVTGKPYYQVLHEMILKPQGLKHTIFYPEDTTSMEIARPWSVDLDRSKPLQDLQLMGYSSRAMFSFAYSAGAIMQNAEDNAVFWSKLTSGQILNSSSIKEMTHLFSLAFNQGYGLGIFRYKPYDNHTIFCHGGTNIGYINENLADSNSGICISFLSNQDSLSNDILLNTFIRAMHKVTINVAAAGISEEPKHVSKVNTYPNPATNFLKVDIGDKTFGLMQLYDIRGREQISSSLHEGVNLINITRLKAGSYIMRLTIEDDVYTEKIQVNK